MHGKKKNVIKKVKRRIDRDEIYELITRNWPIHITEIAQKMNLLTTDENKNKLVITHLKYHVDQLARSEKIKIKKIGHAVVTWPSDIERLRMVHELLRTE